MRHFDALEDVTCENICSAFNSHETGNAVWNGKRGRCKEVDFEFEGKPYTAVRYTICDEPENGCPPSVELDVVVPAFQYEADWTAERQVRFWGVASEAILEANGVVA